MGSSSCFLDVEYYISGEGWGWPEGKYSILDRKFIILLILDIVRHWCSLRLLLIAVDHVVIVDMDAERSRYRECAEPGGSLMIGRGGYCGDELAMEGTCKSVTR